MSKPIVIPTREEVLSLLEQNSLTTNTGLRNRAAIALMAFCGLRISEVLDLERKSVDFEKQTLQILNSKFGKSRILAFNAQTGAILTAWRERAAAKGIKSQYFVSTLQGKHMKTAYFRELLPRLCEKGGLPRMHCHLLRHYYAVNLLNSGATLVHIMQALGHSNLSVSSRYLNHINKEELLEFLRGVE